MRVARSVVRSSAAMTSVPWESGVPSARAIGKPDVSAEPRIFCSEPYKVGEHV